MIVLSGALVLVALVLLVVGALGRDLPYVYGSIGVSVTALLLLFVAILQRRGQTGDDEPAEVAVDSTAEQERVPALVGAGTSQEPESSVAAVEPQDPPTRVSRLVRRPQSADEPVEDEPGAPLPDGPADSRPEVEDAVEDDEEYDDEAYDDEAYEDVDDLEDQPAGEHELGEDDEQDWHDEDEQDWESDEEDDEHEEDHEGVRLVPSLEALEALEAQEAQEQDRTAGPEVLVVSGRPRYHLSGCRYLIGKSPSSVALDDAQAQGFSPCGVCKPDTVLLAGSPDEDEPRPGHDELQQDDGWEPDEHPQPSPAEDELPEHDPGDDDLSLTQVLFGEQALGDERDGPEELPPVGQDDPTLQLEPQPGPAQTAPSGRGTGARRSRARAGALASPDLPAEATPEDDHAAPAVLGGDEPQTPVEPVPSDDMERQPSEDDGQAPDAASPGHDEPADASLPLPPGAADDEQAVPAAPARGWRAAALGGRRARAEVAPVEDGPASQALVGDVPVGDVTTGDVSVGDGAVGDGEILAPTGAPSVAPNLERSTGDEPSGDEPSGDEPSGDEPSGDEPSGDEPSADALSERAPDEAAPSDPTPERTRRPRKAAAPAEPASEPAPQDATATDADATPGPDEPTEPAVGRATRTGKAKAAEAEARATATRRKATKATPAKATPSKATPSKATPSKATPSKATPSKATPSKAAPTATPAKGTAARSGAGATAGPARGRGAPEQPAPTPIRTTAVRAVRADALRLTAPVGATSTRRVAVRAAAPAARPGAAPTAAPATSPAPRGGRVVVIPDRGRFHRADCRYVRGVDGATTLTKAAAASQGYLACGVCQP